MHLPRLSPDACGARIAVVAEQAQQTHDHARLAESWLAREQGDALAPGEEVMEEQERVLVGAREVEHARIGRRRERGPANLIQGLRDFFGAHTYRRTDADGYFHTRWSQDGTEVESGGQPRSAASGTTAMPSGSEQSKRDDTPDTGPTKE